MDKMASAGSESYTGSWFTQFLWWLSTAEKELIASSIVDRNRYRIIGMSVLATWLFATLAWTYFFSTVVNNPAGYTLLGIFMGFMILTIDRALIKGITKFNRNKFSALVFRGLLALTIGIFMAQPAILYMFDKEIKLQISLDNEYKKIKKRDELNSLYSMRKSELNNRISSQRSSLGKKYAEVQDSRKNYLAETDGSGGSGKVGIKDIALAKKDEYEKLDMDYAEFLKLNEPMITADETEIRSINMRIDWAGKQFESLLNDGFLTRIEALNNLVKSNSALQFRYYLLVIILLLIELMPVITKILLPSGSYDEKVRLRDEMEKQLAHSDIKREQEMRELYNRLSGTHDEEALVTFFELTKEDRNEKMRGLSEMYRANKDETFDDLWGMMQRNVLSKFP